MASLSIFCQSRIKRGDSTVIILTEAQFKKTNDAFVSLNDSIGLYRNMLRSVEKDFTQFQIQTNRQLIDKIKQRDSINHLYLSNKRMYEFREREFRKERFGQQVFTAIVMFIAVVLASK